MKEFIRDSINCFVKHPIMTLFLVLQSAITVFAIYTLVYNYEYTEDQIESTTFAYSNYSFGSLRPVSADMLGVFVIGTKGDSLERIDKLYNDLMLVDGLEIVVCNGLGPNLQLTKSFDYFDSEDKAGHSGLFPNSHLGEYYLHFYSSYVGSNYTDFFNLDVSEGRSFIPEDFVEKEDGSIPVILGSRFKKYFSVGDSFEAFPDIENYETPKTLQVIGFVEDSCGFIDASGVSLTTFSDRVIIPYYNDTISDHDDVSAAPMLAMRYNSSYFMVEKSRFDEVYNEIERVISENGMTGVCEVNINKASAASIVNNVKERFSVRLAASVAIIIFSVISFVFIALTKVENNIRRFSIHILCGATYSNIIFGSAAEIMIWSLYGAIVGLVFFIFFPDATAQAMVGNISVHIGSSLYKGSLICLFFFALIYVLVSLIIRGKLKGYDLSSLIRKQQTKTKSNFPMYKIILFIMFSAIGIFSMFIVGYINKLSAVDMYYRGFASDNATFVNVMQINDNSNDKKTLDLSLLGQDYTIYRYVDDIYDDQSPLLRGVYSKGDMPVPEVLNGRYFSDSELTSSAPVKIAVAGARAYEDFSYENDKGVRVIDFYGTELEVIGIMGKSDIETNLDYYVFVPMSTVNSVFSQNGMYYIDGLNQRDVLSVIDNIKMNVGSEGTVSAYKKQTVVLINTPIDIVILMYAVLIINGIVFSIYYIEKKQHIFAVKKFLGYSLKEIFLDTFWDFLSISSSGFVIGNLIMTVISKIKIIEVELFNLYSLDPQTLFLSFIFTSFLALIFAAIAINRTYNRDTSE
ncbi:MAG: ABC transporter permease, partial [Ruminococcaceae bacterium]|nr:ABC transporter permease [Oscillospiraceae bacterium]